MTENTAQQLSLFPEAEDNDDLPDQLAEQQMETEEEREREERSRQRERERERER